MISVYQHFITSLLTLGIFLLVDVQAYVTNNPSETVSIGRCVIKTMAIYKHQVPRILRPLSPNLEYRLPNNHTYEFRVYTRFQILPQTRKFSLNEDLRGTSFNTNKPSMVIVHGLTEDGLEPYYVEMKNEYLKKVDGNVIIVSWPQGATLREGVMQALTNIRGVTCQLAILMTNMVEKRNYELQKVHLVGFSAGGQTVGLVGQRMKEFLNGRQVKRITGLDTAGQWFNNQSDPDEYTNKGDAIFVDIIHSSAGASANLGIEFGFIKPVGDIDFFPDGGQTQDSCIIPENNDWTKLCSHSQSLFDFTKSINGPCDYTSYPCPVVADPSSTKEDWTKCTQNTEPSQQSKMGYHSIDNPGNGGPHYLSIPKTPECSTVISTAELMLGLLTI